LHRRKLNAWTSRTDGYACGRHRRLRAGDHDRALREESGQEPEGPLHREDAGAVHRRCDAGGPHRQHALLIGIALSRGSRPETLAPYWEPEYTCLHGPDWWQAHWAKSGKVIIDHVDAIKGGWQDWHRFEELALPRFEGWRHDDTVKEIAMLKADQGELLGLARVVATKRE